MKKIYVTLSVLVLGMSGQLTAMREDEKAFDKITIPGLGEVKDEEINVIAQMRMSYAWTQVCTDERLAELWSTAVKKDRSLVSRAVAAFAVRAKAKGDKAPYSRKVIKEFGDILAQEMALQNKHLEQQNAILSSQVKFLESYKKDSDAHTLQSDKTNRWRYWLSSVSSWILSGGALAVSITAILR